MSSTSKDIVKRESMKMGEQGFEFTFDGMFRFAEGLVRDGLAPKNMQAGAVMGIMEAGKELGMAPMYALANLTFINNRIGIMGDAAKAIIRSAGVLKPGTDFETIYSGTPYTESWACTVTAHRDGQLKPFESKFEFRQALRAGLVRMHEGKPQSKAYQGWGETGPWALWTERMMMYRALGFLCKDRFSDILGGCVLTEELRDHPQAERNTIPPAEPDPLLSGTIEAEVIDEAAPFEPAAEPPQKPHKSHQERTAAVITALTGAGTLAAVEKAWRLSKGLQDELRDPIAGVDPHLFADLKKVYQECAAKFAPKDQPSEPPEGAMSIEYAKDLANRVEAYLLAENDGSKSKAELALSELTAGKVQQFVLLATYVFDHNEISGKLIAAMEE